MNEALKTVIPVKKRIKEEIKRTIVPIVELEQLEQIKIQALKKKHVCLCCAIIYSITSK